MFLSERVYGKRGRGRMITALILSGGTGTRVGSDIPKQYIKVKDKPILIYCLEQLSQNEQIDAIQIVAAPEWQDVIMTWLMDYHVNRKFKGFSEPGENRQLSIFHGLESLREYASRDDLVVIHDAARPFITQEMINECIMAAKGHDGVLPVLPMNDTVYYSEEGKVVSSLLERSRIFAGQAPEVFVLGKYYVANKCLLPDAILKINGSTEPAIMAGMDIAMIPGDEGNFKITTKADLERFSQIIESR